MTAKKVKAPVLGPTEAFEIEPTHENEGLKMDSTTTSKTIAIPDLAVVNGQITTTSTQVAEHFQKAHRDVLRAIRNLECSDGYRLRNFAQSSYLNEQGKQQPCFRMTRDGFVFLAMGFTGKEAALWKEAYIDAFNRMEKALSSDSRHPSQVLTVNEMVNRLANQVDCSPTELFMPLVNAVMRKQGYTFLMPVVQEREVMDRLDRLGKMFHPMGTQFADVVGVIRLLRGADPKTGQENGRFKAVIQKFESGMYRQVSQGVLRASECSPA